MFLITTTLRPKPKQELIGCEGATDHINFAINGQWQIYINDSYAGTNWYSSELWEDYGLVYEGDNTISLKNTTSNFIRVRLVPTEQPTHGVPDDNPTFMLNQDDGVITFCLAPYQISCDGALDRIDLGGFYGCWTVLINGLPLDVPPYEVGNGTTIENWWSEILIAIREDGRVSLEYDGELHTIWRNNTSENIRMELIGLPDPDSPNLSAINDYPGVLPEEVNPTLLLENPVENFPESFSKVSFCLAPSTCAAQDADIIINRSIPLPAGTYYMEYQVNEGNWQRIEKTYSAQVHADDLGMALFDIYDENGWALIETSGGGIGAFDQDGLRRHPTPFESYRARHAIRASPLVPYYQPELAIRKPTTLKFRTSLGAGTDAVQLYFGGDVELHACTYAFWPGL